MRRFLFSLLSVVCSISMLADDGNGRWTVYSSYHNATKCVCVGSKVYVLSYGGLFSYDSEDSSVETYTRANALSDNAIADIVYCRDAKELVIVYDNGNIDLMNDDGDVYNITDLKLKTPQSDLDLDLYFRYDRWKSYGEFLDSVRISAEIRPSILAMDDIADWAPAIRGL